MFPARERESCSIPGSIRIDPKHGHRACTIDTEFDNLTSARDATVFANGSRGIIFNPQIHPSVCPTTRLPPYIKSLPRRMTGEDISYLSKSGALSLPRIHLRNELLESYIKHLHGCMPILDLHVFLHVIDRGDAQDGQVSLLLLQCVMLAGAAFVDMKYLADAGFTTRIEARNHFYQKARVRI